MKYRDLMINVNALRDQLKERSRIFDVTGKESCATAFGCKFNTFYDLPFGLWTAQATRLSEKLSAMSRDIEDVEVWCGQKLSKVPFSNWMHIYDDWLSEVWQLI